MEEGRTQKKGQTTWRGRRLRCRMVYHVEYNSRRRTIRKPLSVGSPLDSKAQLLQTGVVTGPPTVRTTLTPLTSQPSRFCRAASGVAGQRPTPKSATNLLTRHTIYNSSVGMMHPPPPDDYCFAESGSGARHAELRPFESVPCPYCYSRRHKNTSTVS